jgi:hypothetical protein
MAKASSMSHLFSPLFPVDARRLDSYMLHLTSPLQGGSTSLRSTNNYRNSSNNYQRRDIIPRGGAGQLIPPPPPSAIVAIAPLRTEPPLTSPFRQIWNPKQNSAADQQTPQISSRDPRPPTHNKNLAVRTNRCRIQGFMHAGLLYPPCSDPHAPSSIQAVDAENSNQI